MEGSPRAYCITSPNPTLSRMLWCRVDYIGWRVLPGLNKELCCLPASELVFGFLSFTAAWSDCSWPKDMLSSVFQTWNSPRFQEHMGGKQGLCGTECRADFCLLRTNFFIFNSLVLTNIWWVQNESENQCKEKEIENLERKLNWFYKNSE